MWVFKKVHSTRIFNLSLILILILKSFVNFNDFNEYCVSYMSIHCSHLCLCWKKTSVPINQCAHNKVICPIRWKTCFTYYWNFLACFMKFIFQSMYYTTQWKRVIHSVQDCDWLVDVHSYIFASHCIWKTYSYIINQNPHFSSSIHTLTQHFFYISSILRVLQCLWVYPIFYYHT